MEEEQNSGSNVARALPLIGCIPTIIFPAVVLLFFIMLLGAAFSGGDSVPTGSKGGTGGGDLAACSVTADQIRTILTEKYESQGYNLAPHSDQIYNAACELFNVNPLLSMAIMHHDSAFGTAGAGETCRNPGNIGDRADNYVDAGVETSGDCATRWGGSSRWEGFSTYGDGAQAQMWLLRKNYLDDEEDLLRRAEAYRRNSDDPRLRDIPESNNLLLGMMLKYAPPTDGNDTVGYVLIIMRFMEENASV